MKRRSSDVSLDQGNSKRRQTEESSDDNEDPNSSNPDLYIDAPKEAEVGVIEKISLKNFMCHNRLDVTLGANVNFIIGNNGSGKSAVVTALVVGLGGKATTTNRGSSMREFIKIGKQTGEVEVRLRNRGTDAYKPEAYGQTIVVQRKFNGDGSSSYRLKSKDGKLVSTKKDDLVKILDQFNIQVDNPLAILNQDTSRNFLNSKSSHDKYKFFLKATQLEQVRDEYTKAGEQKNITKDIIEQKQQTLPKLEREVLEWEQKFKSIMAIDDLKQKINNLKNELAWSFVIEKEKGLPAREKDLRQEESKLPRYKQKAEDAKSALDDVSQRKSQLLNNLNQSGNEVQEIQPVHKEARTKLAEQKKLTRNAHMDMKRHEGAITHIKKDRASLLEKIEEIQSSAQHDYEAEKRERIEAISSLQEQLDSYQATETTTDHQLDQFRGAITKYKNDQYNVVKEIQECEKQIQKAQRNLETLKSSQGNNLKRYGGFLPDLVRQIDEHARQGLFHKKPVGPLGANITLRDQKWALAVECCLKGLMYAFCCNDYDDERVLERIISNCCPPTYKPTIIVSRFKDRVHNVSNERAQSQSYPALIDVIQSDHPTVINTLIDQRTIEKVLMIQDGREARRVMDPDNGPTPHKAREAFTLKGDQVFSVPTFRYYSSNQDNARLLTASVEDHISELTNQLQGLHQKIGQLKQDKVQLQAEINDNVTQERQTERSLMKVREKKREVTMKIAELKSVEDPLPVDIATYEDEVRVLEDQLREQESQLEAKTAVFKEEESKQTELDARCKEIEVQMRAKMEAAEAIKDEVSNIDNEIETKKTTKKHFEGKLKELEKKVKELNGSLEKYKKDIETNITKATQIHEERINTRRTPKNLESEITQIGLQISQEEKQRGDPAEITRNYRERKDSYFHIKKEVAQLKSFVKSLDTKVAGRLERYKEFNRLIGLQVKYSFLVALANRGYTGKLSFNHRKEILELSVQPQSSSQVDGARDVKSLSGGERSFSTVCFILALWDAVESPFRCLDEFDIFMDMVNRRVSMDLMMKTAKAQLCRQFIFLSPLDMSKLGIESSRMKIFQMPNPERGQQTLQFTQQEREEEEA